MGRGGRAGFAGHRVAPPVAGGDLSVPRRARPAAGEAECDQQPPGRRAARDLDGGGGSVPRGTAEAAGERTAGNSGGGQYRRAEERSRVGDCGPSGEERKKKRVMVNFQHLMLERRERLPWLGELSLGLV